MGDRLRHRSRSIPNCGGYTTSSPIFYSIPWNPADYSVSGLGPGQSSMHDMHGNHRPSSLEYSKSGFTYFNNSKCTCGFLSEYRKQYNRRTLQSAHPTCKPWWNGREMTSKLQNIDPKYPCYSMHIQSTYAKDFRGSPGQPANLCHPEGEIERAGRILGGQLIHCHEHDNDYWCSSPSRVIY